MTVMPRESHDWTIDDLELLPDDGLQYELLDGLLLVSPAPVPEHQRLSRGIFRLLDAACPDGYEVFYAPLDWQPDRHTSLQPDVLVVATADVGPRALTTPLPLAVEVLSPSTRRKDMVLKHSKYEDAGVANYWIVDPEVPSVTAYALRDGRYVELGSVQGERRLVLDDPFPVQIVPAQLRER